MARSVIAARVAINAKRQGYPVVTGSISINWWMEFCQAAARPKKPTAMTVTLIAAKYLAVRSSLVLGLRNSLAGRSPTRSR